MSHIVIYNFVTKNGLRNHVIEAFAIVKGAAGLNDLVLYKDEADENKLVCVETWENKIYHDNFISSFTPEQAADFASLFAEPPIPHVYAMAS